MYIIVRGNGQNHTSQARERIVAPVNFPAELRRGFLDGAAQILLRPPPPLDQDRTIAGRRGLYFTIARLLPLYEQFAPESGSELRVQLSSLAPDIPEDLRTGNNRLLNRGLVPGIRTATRVPKLSSVLIVLPILPSGTFVCSCGAGGGPQRRQQRPQLGR